MDTPLPRVAAALVIAFLLVGALYFADVVFEPVAFALFGMAIVWPLQKALEKRLPQGLALVVTLLVAVAVVGKLASMVAWGAGQIAFWLTQNFERVQTFYVVGVKWLEEHDIFIVTLAAERFNVIWVLRAFQTIASRVNSFVAFGLLVLIFMAMGLMEAEVFGRNLRALCGENGARLIAGAVATGKKFRRYMLVRTLASMLTGLIVWGFCALVGVELAGAWGVIAFALNYIPFIGPLIATALPTLFALAQTGSPQTAGFVLAVLTVVQFLIGSYFEPLFTAKSLAISPFLVIFAVFFWSFIWGLPGTFIGVPIAIAILTLAEHFPASRWIALLLSGRPADERAEEEKSG